MTQRRIPPKQPQKIASYFEARDGWHVKLRHGARVIRDERAESKEAAIATTKALLEEFPGSTYELCTLGECWAWETPDGWVYSRTADDPSAECCRVLDELGTIVLEIRGAGHVRFIDGAVPVSQTAAKPPVEPPHHHGDGGAKYPSGDPELTDEERQRYDDIHAEIIERLKRQTKGRRSRWQPPK